MSDLFRKLKATKIEEYMPVVKVKINKSKSPGTSRQIRKESGVK